MNELTPERLTEIKRYMGNVNLPFRVQADLPLLVAEVERLTVLLFEFENHVGELRSELFAAQKRISELERLYENPG